MYTKLSNLSANEMNESRIFSPLNNIIAFNQLYQ